jgi:hypothetical protein
LAKKRWKQKQSIKSKKKKKMAIQDYEMRTILKELETKLSLYYKPNAGYANVNSIGTVVGRQGYSFEIRFTTPCYVSRTIAEVETYGKADNEREWDYWDRRRGDRRGDIRWKRGTNKISIGLHCTLDSADREIKRAINSFYGEIKRKNIKLLTKESTDDDTG